MAKPIHQEITFKASAKGVYDALLDSKQFSDFTGGAPARIEREVGGVFSCFGGVITGRNIELLPNQRIVQAWRVGNWPDGVYSIVKFELQAHGSETRLVMDHTGFPDHLRAHLNGEEADGGWHRQYWEPLKKYLA
jgi:activator of HSP90 ATPase